MGYKVTVSVKYIGARVYMPEWGMLHSCVEIAHALYMCVTLSTLTSGLVMSLVLNIMQVITGE